MSHSTDYDLFPADVETAQIPKISFAKIVANDPFETERFFRSCTDRGILLLDLQDEASGKQVLNDVARMFALAEGIFDLDQDEKMRHVLSWKNMNGYKGAGMGTIDSNGTPDRCEFYTIGRDDFTGMSKQPQPQPAIVEQNAEAVRSFMTNSDGIISVLLSRLEHHLHLTPGTLAAKHPPIKPSGSQIRLLRYAPQLAHDRRTSLVPHSDLGSLTILFNVLGGLQILASPESSGVDEDEWVYIKPEPGCAIVNVGDALAKWTGNLLKSPKHRVTYAPGRQAELVRYSVAWFARPEHAARMVRLTEGDVIPRLKEGEPEEEDITAEEWHEKMSKVHAAKLSRAASSQ